LSERLHLAWELAALLRQRRFAAGSLDLEMPELKVRVDSSGRAVKLERVEPDRSHQLIEEFMLAANEAVAQVTRQRLIPSLYRVHDQPNPEKLAEFRELARQHGMEVGNLEIKSELLRLIEMIRGRPEERAMKGALLRSLAKARYSPDADGHYGLAKSNYTHFTSPIRRYADLVVHRVLGMLFHDTGEPRKPGGGGTGRPAPDDLKFVAKHISGQEERAAEAEREAVALKKVEFFAEQLKRRCPEPFDAVVVEVRNFGLFVELPEVLTTGVIHVSSFADDFYRFDAVRMRFVGQRRKRTLGLGDRLKVIVSRVDRFKRQIDFAPVSS
jgi:ribonuclease R